MLGSDGGTDRRDFFGRVLGGAMVAGAATAIPRELLALETAPAPETRALVHEWEHRQEKVTWDMSWLDRIRGRYRQVFDAPEISEGTVFHQTRVFMRGYIDVYDCTDADFAAVMVIRHGAIPLVANDRLWDELELGKQFRLKDPETGKPARRNPFLNANNPRGSKHTLIWPDGGLDTLLQRGAIALCCNLALFRIVGMVAKRDKVDSKAARDKVLANLVPGVIVQPSGIFAVARAQEAGCNYIQA